MCSYWRKYELYVSFSVIVSFGVEVAFEIDGVMDAFALLHAQTACPLKRYTRDAYFFATAFKHLAVKPAIVERPARAGKLKGRMWGVLAEIPINTVNTHVHTLIHPNPCILQRNHRTTAITHMHKHTQIHASIFISFFECQA